LSRLLKFVSKTETGSLGIGAFPSIGLCLCFCGVLYREARLAPTDRQIGSIESRSAFGL
jgi:hypothetical protein